MTRDEMFREELNHLEDEEWDRNRAKRERLKECVFDAQLGDCVSMGQQRRQKFLKESVCGSKRKTQ